MRNIVGKLTGTMRDVRALGAGSLLRAAYEASKRAGGHRLVFGRLVPQSNMPSAGASPFPVPEVPDEVRKRTLVTADRIVSGVIELFSQRLELGNPPDWHSAIHDEGSWPATDWWRIDLRSAGRQGDVKWVWELGRHHHLVVLARAVHLDPNNAAYHSALNGQLESWLDANPPETGVHWYSNLEIALRAIAWLQILALAAHQLKPEVTSRMWQHLHHSGRHLLADLPYTVSTMRNNHLLGDALGLVALGKSFPGSRGERWARAGDRIFHRQLRRHMNPDGSMIEDSVSYQRFVLEMLAVRTLLGGASDEVRKAMADAGQFLARLGALEGPVPQYGDWDQGRVLTVAAGGVSLPGSVRLALALSGDGAPDDWRAANDECAWYVGPGQPATAQAAGGDGNEVGAGVARAVAGDTTVWLKGGSGHSHGHADLSSVAICVRGQWLLGDPGTGTYNGPLQIRNYFRSSVAHNVVRVEGVDQLEPHRAFRWAHRANGQVGEPVRVGDAVVLWAVHDAYTRLTPSRRVARVVIVRPESVSVSDHVEGPPTSVATTLPLHPDADWQSSRITVGDESFELAVASGEIATARGSSDPYLGWWSDTYGSLAPATALSIHSDSARPIGWTLKASGTPDEPPGAPRVSIRFDGPHTRLRVETVKRTVLRSI